MNIEHAFRCQVWPEPGAAGGHDDAGWMAVGL
jgi:hypothetical protein